MIDSGPGSCLSIRDAISKNTPITLQVEFLAVIYPAIQPQSLQAVKLTWEQKSQQHMVH